jgi:hypothetical protein
MFQNKRSPNIYFPYVYPNFRPMSPFLLSLVKIASLRNHSIELNHI